MENNIFYFNLRLFINVFKTIARLIIRNLISFPLSNIYIDLCLQN